MSLGSGGQAGQQEAGLLPISDPNSCPDALSSCSLPAPFQSWILSSDWWLRAPKNATAESEAQVADGSV